MSLEFSSLLAISSPIISIYAWFLYLWISISTRISVIFVFFIRSLSSLINRSCECTKAYVMCVPFVPFVMLICKRYACTKDEK